MVVQKSRLTKTGINLFALSAILGIALLASLALYAMPIFLATALIAGIILSAIFVVLPAPRRLLLGLLIFVIPLNVDETFRQHPSPGGADGLTFGLVEIVLMLLFFITFLQRIQSGRNRSIQLYPTLLFPSFMILVFYFVSLINARDLLWSSFDIFNFIKVILLFLIVAFNIQDERDVHIILCAFFMGVIVQAIMATAINMNPAITILLLKLKIGVAAEVMTANDALVRSGASLGNSNHLGRFLGLLLPIAYAIFFTQIRGKLRFLAGFAALLGTVALVSTLSRSAWAGLVFSFVIMAPLMIKNRLVSYRTLWLLGLAGVFAGLFLFAFGDLLWARLTGDDHGSAMTRITTAKVAWLIIKDYPFFGCGINNYGGMLAEYWIGEDTFTNKAAVHNNYLLYMAEIGVIGFTAVVWWLLAFAARICIAIKSKSRFYSAVAIGILGGYSSMLLESLSDKSYKENFSLLLTIWALVAVTEGIIRLNGERENDDRVFAL